MGNFCFYGSFSFLEESFLWKLKIKVHNIWSFIERPYCCQIKKLFSLSILKTSVKNYIETILVNKIHGIFLTTNYTKFDQKVDLFDWKSFIKEITYLVSKVAIKSTSNFNMKGFFYLFLFPENKQVRIDSEDWIIFFLNIFIGSSYILSWCCLKTLEILFR